MTITLDSKIPGGPVADAWNTYKSDVKLVAPGNKRKFKVIVVGTGLAGASAAATLAELGYQVDAFTFHDSPRRQQIQHLNQTVILQHIPLRCCHTTICAKYT